MPAASRVLLAAVRPRCQASWPCDRPAPGIASSSVGMPIGLAVRPGSVGSSVTRPIRLAFAPTHPR